MPASVHHTVMNAFWGMHLKPLYPGQELWMEFSEDPATSAIGVGVCLCQNTQCYIPEAAVFTVTAIKPQVSSDSFVFCYFPGCRRYKKQTDLW